MLKLTATPDDSVMAAFTKTESLPRNSSTVAEGNSQLLIIDNRNNQFIRVGNIRLAEDHRRHNTSNCKKNIFQQ